MEGELVRLALLRIEQDPSQFNLFIDMLRDTEGMDLIVTTLTAGELRCILHISYVFMNPKALGCSVLATLGRY